MPPTVIGLDIGGANLKVADPGRRAELRSFELWKNPGGLTDALAHLLHDWPRPDRFAVTMTGELCDCFETKRQGVTAILHAVEQIAASTPIRVWTMAGRFVNLPDAQQNPLPCAAANWLGLATFAGRMAPTGPALLVEVGSTTSDIVLLVDGRPMPRGHSDPERLRSGELVYTGIRRTPVCALLGGAGAAECFATTQDVYLLMGVLPEDARDRNTADGRPATRKYAEARLARMLCADAETISSVEIAKLANAVFLRQVHLLQYALGQVTNRLPCPPETVILSGSGEFLARLVLEEHTTFRGCRVVSLADRLGPTVSSAACAYAVAALAAEED
jgi:(4-(4-[2-(gamma-L-glutamylamino)ethyl]phenoxymethyl)furan-2-yl)methanamine synthase